MLISEDPAPHKKCWYEVGSDIMRLFSRGDILVVVEDSIALVTEGVRMVISSTLLI